MNIYLKEKNPILLVCVALAMNSIFSCIHSVRVLDQVSDFDIFDRIEQIHISGTVSANARVIKQCDLKSKSSISDFRTESIETM